MQNLNSPASGQSNAEREGFEPSIRFPACTLSKRAPSATRPPLLYQVFSKSFLASGRQINQEKPPYANFKSNKAGHSSISPIRGIDIFRATSFLDFSKLSSHINFASADSVVISPPETTPIRARAALVSYLP